MTSIISILPGCLRSSWWSGCQLLPICPPAERSSQAGCWQWPGSNDRHPSQMLWTNSAKTDRKARRLVFLFLMVNTTSTFLSWTWSFYGNAVIDCHVAAGPGSTLGPAFWAPTNARRQSALGTDTPQASVGDQHLLGWVMCKTQRCRDV